MTTQAPETLHGYSRSRPGRRASATYQSWHAMKQRCLNPHRHEYRYYGGRGITIDSSWLSFAQFLTDMGERPADRSLDRIDNDGNYEPGNCRWATIEQQSANQRHGESPLKAAFRERALQVLVHRERGFSCRATAVAMGISLATVVRALRRYKNDEALCLAARKALEAA